MIKRLRAKFIAANMATVTVMLAVIFCLIFGSTRESIERENLRMMETLGQSPMELFGPEAGLEQIDLPYFVLQIDILGNVTGISGGYSDLSQEFLANALTGALESGQEMGVIREYRLRFLRVDTRVGPRFVFADMSSEEAALGNLVKNFLVVGAAALAAFFGLSWWVASRAVAPVEKAWLQQKQFIADASHELKTPLTVILTNAELLQNSGCDEAERQQFSGSILRMAGQMRSLVERLLTLSRMDNNASNMVMERLDFSALVEESILPFEPLYFERELTLQSKIAPDLAVTGSREHLAQVLDILLDNAMKYSDAPGDVWVHLKKQGKDCLLAVSNPGPAMEKEELERIFERFYRADKARSRDGGCGLGLPIARSIVQEHGGKLWAESAGGFHTFFLSLHLES